MSHAPDATGPGHPRTGRDRGASSVEYGLVLAAVSAVVAAVVFGFGGFVNQSFEDSTACLTYSGPGDTDC